MRSKILKRLGGFSLVEVVISMAILGIIVGAGLSLYLSQQKQWLIQEQVADAQQNVRVTMDELVMNIRMAGCGDLPWGMLAMELVDADPDTLVIRHNPDECRANIARNVQSNTIHIREDPRCFEVGVRAYIWDYDGHVEWFTVGHIAWNEGKGWYEVHGSKNFAHVYKKQNNPRTMVLQERRYYIDHTTDGSHPVFMRAEDGLPAQVFAENIEDFQAAYVMKNGIVTTSPDTLHNVRALQLELRARTERQDPDWTDSDYGDGYRRRTLTTQVDARNLGL
jgi:prepilin-type N-terminal cleavage/methylation domain-containing protein